MSMKYDSFDQLFSEVGTLKDFVVKLSVDDRIKFRRSFFSMDFPQWQLTLIWEFFWGDKTYETIHFIFTQKKLLKRSDSNEH